MARPVLPVTRRPPPALQARAARDFEARLNAEDRPIGGAELRRLAAGAAAGLDVYGGEPRVHPGYLALENVVLLPHLGSATHATRDAMGFLALDGIAAVLNGNSPPNRVA